jgi:CTP synthase
MDAIRQFTRRHGSTNVLNAMVVYLPYLEASKELKTKPAQNALRDLAAAGVRADVVFARAERPVDPHIINKISLFSGIEREAIVALPTASSVYEVPLTLEESGIAAYVCRHFNLPAGQANLTSWKRLNTVIARPSKPKVRIGIVAKYMDHEDTYMSVTEALRAAAWAHEKQPELVWIDAEAVEKDGPNGLLDGLGGVVVPGGFGSRGVEGKIAAAAYAIDHNLPYLGLCLGMQVAVIAKARQAGLTDANTAEVDPNTKHPVIALMDAQRHVVDKGGTMRLGNYPCVLTSGSLAAKAYGSQRITERHRHRYEFNNAYREQLAKAGLKIVGTSPDNKLVEVIEMADHPFFVASQFHPEFTSRPNRPQPLFAAFIAAAIK